MAIREVGLRSVRITDRFWASRQRLMTDVTIPYMERILRDEVEGAEKSHAIGNFRIAAGEENGHFYGMVFQDSDVAKWLEATAYSLALKEDADLEDRVDSVIALIGLCQQPDGYLNTYFTVKEPENRWTNLLECHELYCAGHMMEAGVALYEAVGKRSLLDICIRLADHICERFGEGGEEAIPGHQEVEIGLLRIYHTLGSQKYLDMALRFLNLRGQDPEWFLHHTPKHPGVHYGGYDILPEETAYNQSDIPVREQSKARGHAVRQVYMLAAMADAALCTNDSGLVSACERMFMNITQRQMYVTGAIGSSAHRESFTDDFHLPSDSGYGETCASVAMAFFARNMLRLSADGRYADLMERVLFNAALAGMSLDGTRFFYANPLEVTPSVSGSLSGYEHVLSERPLWHKCACCPPNLARLLTSLGKCLWSEDNDAIYSHLFIGSEVCTAHADIALKTSYPWQGQVQYTIGSCKTQAFALKIHIPYHIDGFVLKLNGMPVEGDTARGYCCVRRTWARGDVLQVDFDMPMRRIYADPRVRDAAGKVALSRGPLIYCFEGTDNSKEFLSTLLLPRAAKIHVMPYDDSLLGGIIPLEADGLREEPGKHLYGACAAPLKPVRLRAIPYYAYGNRGNSAMTVWLREH